MTPEQRQTARERLRAVSEGHDESYRLYYAEDMPAALVEIDRLEDELFWMTVCEWESHPRCTCSGCETKRKLADHRKNAETPTRQTPGAPGVWSVHP